MTKSPTTIQTLNSRQEQAVPRGPKLAVVVAHVSPKDENNSGRRLLVLRPVSETLSSTLVEYGDEPKLDLSAPGVANHIFRSWTARTRTPHDDDSESQASTSTVTISQSQDISKSRLASNRRISDKVNTFLYNIGQLLADHDKEFITENRGLHQRIAALQRNERDLLKENQDLAQQLRTFQKQHDGRRRQWQDESRQDKMRLKELEARLAQQEDLSPTKPNSSELVVSDSQIIAWFAARGAAWRSWAEQYGYRDADRVQSGLHPSQQKELAREVQGFVHLTETGALPEIILKNTSPSQSNIAHVLLHGMLANFIVLEAFHSPFWIFDALSGAGDLGLESPNVPHASSMSPVGFRMDLAMWNNVGALRSARHPQAMSAVLANQPALNESRPVAAAVPMHALTLDTTSIPSHTSLLNLELPLKEHMNNLYEFLIKVQKKPS
ncbi:hypothetical protein B0H66DRAFT_167823 [Apodospora peruviana]|uniref:Uncharacterized protein n=1 Tax=Apodospora peruviana TaxID=516989 RepID=A0AAE0MBQ2_9PEZI|nr:hypothetical protein B0H66DRAFT_167823 [Apodospora peruviana]